MASAALKTVLACPRQGAALGSDPTAVAARFDGAPLQDGGVGDLWILLFDRPRQAVECALLLTRDTAESGNASRGRCALHLAEIDLIDEVEELDPAAREVLELLMRLALDGQILVSKAAEILLQQSSASASRSGDAPTAWVWRHHGRYCFSSEDRAIEVIEVGDREDKLRPPRDDSGVVRITELEARELVKGDRLLRYRILDVLGRGGMGVVYRAEDGRLRRHVALKTLPARLANDRHHLQRFEREVQAIAAVSHPNIVTLHNVERDGDVRFLTMELVEGELLADAIPETGLPLQRILHIGTALADALDAAHRQGIVHRDLKPGNVMLTPEGRVKVLDFGLAKLRDDTRDTVTDSGQMIGTLAYMAPEQIRGYEVDARIDLFALGVLLYEMATGRRPFRGQGASLMYAVLHDEPTKLERPDLPPELIELIYRCLQKEPGQRVSSAEEIRHRLAEIRSDAGYSGDASQAAKSAPWQRQRFRLWAAGLVAASALAYTAVILPPSPGPPTPAGAAGVKTGIGSAGALKKPRLVVLPCRDGGEVRESFFAAGLTTDITSRLAAEPSLEVIAYASALSYLETDRDPQDIARELSASHVVTCDVTWQAPEAKGSGTHGLDLAIAIQRSSDQEMLSRRTFAEKHRDPLELQALLAQRAVAEVARTFSMTPSTPRASSDIRAHSAYLRGLHQAKMPDYTPGHRRSIIRHFEKAVEADPNFVLAWAELAKAQALFFHLRHDMSGEQKNRALDAAARARALDPDSPQVRLAEGLVHYWAERRYDEALVDLRAAAEGLPSEWEVYASMAWIHRRQGSGQEAWEGLNRALALNPRDPVLRTHIGITATWLRNYPEARRLLESAISESPDKPMAFWLLALTHWLEDGDLDGARRVLEAMPENDPRIHWFWFRQLLYERRPDLALERLERIDGWIELTDFSAPVSLARALAWRQGGEAQKAKQEWRDAADELRRAAPSRPRDPRLLAALGVAEAALGNRQAALDAAHRAIEIRPLKSDAYEGPSYLEHLAWVHLLLGDRGDAVRILRELLAMPSRLSPPLVGLDPRWDSLTEEIGR